MPSDISGPVIAAASGLIGVVVGGCVTAHNQKRERQQRRIGEQLGEFYGPMLALREQVLAKSELRLKIAGEAESVTRAVKLKVPAVVGVPLITPVALRFNPAERVPIATAHV